MLKIVLVFYYFSSINLSEIIRDPEIMSIHPITKIISKTFQDLIAKFFIEKNLRFDLIFIGHPSEHIQKVVEGFYDFERFMSVKTITLIKEQEEIFFIHESAIILITDFIIWNSFIESSRLLNISPKDFIFLVYCEDGNCKFNFDLKIYYNIPTYFVHLSYFLQKVHNEIQLISTEWFTETFCNKLQYKIVDTFDLNSKKWNKNLEIPKKFHDFYGCRLSFLVIDYGSARHTIQANDTLIGFLPEIVHIVVEKANAKFSIQYPRHYGGTVLSTLGNFSGTVRPHIVVSEKLLTTSDIQTHLSAVFDDDSLIFALTPSEKYSSYEKLTLPFDQSTWIYLFTTFCIAFVVIFVINQLSNNVRSFFYGEKVQHAAFNVIGAFFGIGQVKLPSGNFPRILLIFFVLFCLVMRTAYQGKKKVMASGYVPNMNQMVL